MQRKILFLALTAFVFFMTSCGGLTDSAKKLYNSPDSDEIYIGVAYPVEARDADTYYIKGVELAVKNINDNGGVLGKTLKTVVRDDKNDTNLAMQIAQTFYEQGITAVVGHWSTNVCYFVEDVYERNKVVMLTPDATGLNIFDNRYNYVYRMIGNNQNFSDAIADYMVENGYKRIAVYFSDDEYGNNFAEIFEKTMVKYRIKVVDRITSITAATSDAIMKRWAAFGCDAVFMAATFPDYMEPIRLIRDIDAELPIFGADNFERTNFADLLGRSTDGIYLASVQTSKLDPGFLENFRDAYSHDPDIQAISGYECVYLLRDAMESAGSVDGESIAGYLSALDGYKTVSGTRTYNPETQEFDGYNASVRKLN